MIGDAPRKVYATGMRDFAATARRLKSAWVLGLAVLFLLSVAAAASGILVAVPLIVLSELFEWRDGLMETWLALSASIWLPLAAGSMADNGFRSLLRRPLGQRDAQGFTGSSH